ncbi:MAG: glutamate synthase large subunit, partial [Actinobacteria bacterium]|nr:glutamate synthase large subunit [Actinomycetota bacterium]
MYSSAAHPAPQGLYDGLSEHDACGVAFVATLTGTASHDIVDKALTALRNLEHRGASGAEPDSGDGAGILLQVPDRFLRGVVHFDLPPAGHYAVGIAFLSSDEAEASIARDGIGAIARQEGLTVLGWREVPTDPSLVGATARSVMPSFWQLFVAAESGDAVGIELDRRAFPLRKRAEHELAIYFASLSARTIVYKGMLTTSQLEPFYPELSDARVESALALVHSRFSTNTFPSWPLAHPYRYISHNGEINTVRGNRNWMQAREAMITSKVIRGDITRLFPICTPGGSDSASFDEVLELLHLGGRSLPHSVLMMIPEAWENNPAMDPARRAFYEFHANFMEPWDGPANVCFTDGTQIGAVLDRNGLRPGRFWVTDEGLVVLASEAGVLDIDPARIVRKGRLQPGLMFLVDTAAGRIIEDDEIKAELAAEYPYADWLRAGLIHLGALPEREHIVHTPLSVARRQQTFGYTEEEMRILVAPMASSGLEPIGSMGTDTPIAVLSTRPRMLFDYFAQLFAQVTNPPLDSIREEIVTSLSSIIGPEGNLLEPTAGHCKQVVLPFPVIDNDELSKVLHINDDGDYSGFAGVRISGLYQVSGGGEALERRLSEIFHEVDAVIRQGKRFIVLSDRDSDAQLAPIPSLLLCAAVHHHLVRTKTRTMAGLLVEAGDIREVHHVALLIGYGAAAVNPYLALESVEDLVRRGVLTDVTPEKAMRNMVKALGKGVLKVMSKMGVSTVASYRGAQIFEAVGLSQGVIDAYFTGTASKLGGVDLDVIAEEVAMRHRVAYPPSGIAPAHRTLNVGGEYQWRREGEPHLFDPETVFRLQHATRNKRFDVFRQYSQRVDEQSERLMTLRGLFRFKDGLRPPISIDEVEPVSSIVKRFSTGAMSYGSISQEAHETLAIAMNRLGAKSNTGEGGEDPERFVPMANGDSKRSAIKQVASGRFGVTSDYLVNSDDIQIKMAQGAKPGEGGQLPGHKVYPWIAKTRYSTPGVGLISPPPHHDIYSIEDLAQLIHDLKNANPRARIHVKLVSEVGVGTVAAGVAKAHADVVLISGHDGGTGASPLTSLKHAGAPWELGLAETQQTLLLNGLRDRVVVQADGQLKTGRDVVIAALLGAEEFGFATAPLVVSGCIMMRVCHLDTCPVGVATQNPVLRERFSGKPEFVETFFEYIAEEVRALLASLGFRNLDEAIGRAETLDVERAVDHWKAAGLDLQPILHVPAIDDAAPRRQTTAQDHGLDRALDNELIALCAPALEGAEPVRAQLTVRNVNRTVGTMLGSEVTRGHGGTGLPDGTIDLTFVGSAGQSFGAFLPAGITLRLEGDGNDYVGKGLSGGRIVVR